MSEDMTLADVFYSGTESIVSSTLPAIRGDVERLRDANGWTADQAREYVESIAHVFNDARIDRTRVPDLHSILTRYALAPADDATVQQWDMESRRHLREKHGEAEATRRLERAKDFLAERPALAKRLQDSGVGSHPKIVEMLTESPHTLRIKPLSRRGN